MVVDLVLLFGPVSARIVIGPRDEATAAWLEQGGDIHIPYTALHRNCLNRAISRRDLPAIAAELQQMRVQEWQGYMLWVDGDKTRHRPVPDVTFRVKAYEYRDVVIGRELVEIT